jgi:hypothetical protein
VFKNRVVRRIFEPKREEVPGVCRIPQNEELRNLYASPNIIRVIKSSEIRVGGNVARRGEMGNSKFLWGKP